MQNESGLSIRRTKLLDSCIWGHSLSAAGVAGVLGQLSLCDDDDDDDDEWTVLNWSFYRLMRKAIILYS